MFLDANVFIHLYQSSGKIRDRCKRLLSRVASGEQSAVTSPLVLDEVLFFFSNERGPPFAEHVWKNILGTPNLKMLPIDDAVLIHVLRYANDGLESHDAFHAATMHANGITTICSFDRDFDRIKGIARQEPK